MHVQKVRAKVRSEFKTSRCSQHKHWSYTERAPRAFARRPATATEPGIEPVGAAFHHAPKHWNKCDEEWSNCCSCRARLEGCSLTEICTGMQFHQSTQQRCVLSPDHRARPHGKQSYKSWLRFHYTSPERHGSRWPTTISSIPYGGIHRISDVVWGGERVINKRPTRTHSYLTRPPEDHN